MIRVFLCCYMHMASAWHVSEENNSYLDLHHLYKCGSSLLKVVSVCNIAGNCCAYH